MPANAFISYAHADAKKLDRLHKHLVMMRRYGTLQAWTDHEIIPGDNFGQVISAALDQSSLFIALLSPDYLASRYCYELEFQRAQELQALGRMRIVAIVLEPCDWLSSPFSELLVLPRDGKPVSEWTNENSAYLSATEGIRRALAAVTPPTTAPAVGAPTATAPAASGRRLMVKQHFDAIQKADFADQAYETIRGYFERCCGELDGASEQIRARYEAMGPTAFTCTIANRALIRNGEAHITLRNNKGGRGPSVGDLSFVYARHAGDGSANGWMTVQADDYQLYLNASIDQLGTGREVKATPDQVAVSLWDAFVQKAGISYA